MSGGSCWCSGCSGSSWCSSSCGRSGSCSCIVVSPIQPHSLHTRFESSSVVGAERREVRSEQYRHFIPLADDLLGRRRRAAEARAVRVDVTLVLHLDPVEAGVTEAAIHREVVLELERHRIALRNLSR